MGKGQVHNQAATGSETTASSGDDESPAQYQPSATRVRPPTRMMGQHKPEVWMCRPEEYLRCVTTLIQEPETGGHCLWSWTKIYDMLGVPEHLQRELVVFSIMLKQPSFSPLDILVNPHRHAGKPVLACGDMESKR